MAGTIGFLWERGQEGLQGNDRRAGTRMKKQQLFKGSGVGGEGRTFQAAGMITAKTAE